MLKGGLLMSLRKRLITGIGLILLILGIGKPLTEAAVQALKPKAVQTSVVETNGSCKPNCNRNGKLLNIPFLSWLPKKQMKNDEDLRVWDTNEKPKKQKDLKPKKKKNKLIVVGVENAKRGTNEKRGIVLIDVTDEPACFTSSHNRLYRLAKTSKDQEAGRGIDKSRHPVTALIQRLCFN